MRTFRYAPRRLEVLGYSRSLDSDETIRPAAALVAPLYLAAARRAVGRLLASERFDLVQAHWIVPNGLAVAPYARRLPVVVGLHGSDVFLAERRGIRAWVRRSLRRVSALTGCSPELVERICALGFERRRSHVIPYGIDVETFRPGAPEVEDWRRRLGIPTHARVLLTVGRMVTKKGFHHLVEVLPALLEAVPDLHVVLAGGGDRLAEFRQRLVAWPDRAHLPGVVYRDALPDLYRAADLFVLPAVHDRRGNVDGLPNVILEAMASGLPVVASEISGIPLAVTSGETGLLVPEADREALRGAIGELLENDRRRREMGEAGRREAMHRLTWSAVARRYRRAYEAALG